MNPWKKGPVDVIDWTCQQHDNCYGEVQKHPVMKSNYIKRSTIESVNK
jgi:hypothetical protein